jgi:hypothetical protein
MSFLRDKYDGRTRVNTFNESKKRRKTHVQFVSKSMCGMDKLYQLQNEFFKDGMKYEEYENYIQKKINNDMFYYRNLSEKAVDELKERYKSLRKIKKDKLNQTLANRSFKNDKKKLFKDKKRNMINIQKTNAIEKLFKEINNTTGIGLTKSTGFLSSDPDNWEKTKKLLFIGGRYFESSDKNWVDVYRCIISSTSAHLFNLHSTSSLNDYVMDS